MSIEISERNQIENEMIFRRINEKIGTDLDVVDAMHVADKNPHLVRDDLIMLLFKCECSDENCEKRIPLRLSKYRELHLDRSTFIVRPRHQVESIENVILEEPEYSLVRKNHAIDEPGDSLHKTTVDNSNSN